MVMTEVGMLHESRADVQNRITTANVSEYLELNAHTCFKKERVKKYATVRIPHTSPAVMFTEKGVQKNTF